MATPKVDRHSVREAMVASASALLAGPLKPDEILDSAPADTYLTGILWPRGKAVGAESDDNAEGVVSADETGPESAIPGYRAIRPCSIGITFAVSDGADVIVSLGSTSRYEADQEAADDGFTSSEAGTDAGSATGGGATTRRRWIRRELAYTFHLHATGSGGSGTIPEFTGSDGRAVRDARLSVHVRQRPGGGQHVFTITLINEELDEEKSGPRDARCLFQTELIVRAECAGQPAILPRPQLTVDSEDEEGLANALLYRDVREFAVGHGIAASWGAELDGKVDEVRTSWLPQTYVRGTSTEGHPILGEFKAAHPKALRAEYLGDESAREAVVLALSDFVKGYERWIEDELNARISCFSGPLLEAARTNLERCIATSKRMRSGVEVLRTDPLVWTAFALANRAMDRQSRFPGKGAEQPPLVWRPFQLGFMLLVIPGLVDPGSEDRECMDLLWFPTGGGKTEAYLALTAFQIFHRRLVNADRRAHGGVDVLMRYTLRLLTVQQFQRAAALITACDFIREEDPRLGSSRIALGLYVGGEATPNAMDEAREALAQEHAGQQPKSTPRQLLSCPVCGGDLLGTHYRADPILPQIEIRCADPECESAGRPLPVYTVDELIYAQPPSLLIGTIDKFAQVPRQVAMRQIFGLDGGSPPGLIIQDELHLISGPLGSMAGLYETVFDALCTDEGIRPKVIGSTATIGHASAQVRSLFDRSVLQFPPPGFDAGDSFYAVRDQSGPDRLYVGIPSAGRSPKFALQAVIAALLQSADSLVKKDGVSEEAIDAYWTCVAYFNSLRELGGAYVLMQDDVPRQMQFLAGRLGSSPRVLEGVPIELSSRKSSRELPELLKKLSATLHAHTRDYNEFPQPEYAVLASNMISVGVDVPRLGLMVVNGQPKSTAEYIQASSRVGRGIPGLVFTLYNFGRPRDLSHFEHFCAYHSALYRSVEATSVTPWAPRARDKALHAVFASLVRHQVLGMQREDEAGRFDPDDPAVTRILNFIRARVLAATDETVAADAADELNAIVDEWATRGAEVRTGAGVLKYWGRKSPFGRTVPHLMQSAEESSRGGSHAWPTPNSMREVEPSTAFVLKTIPRRVEAD